MTDTRRGTRLSWHSRRKQPNGRPHGRRRFDELLSTIDVPDPFDIQVFCDRIATQRGRALHLHSVQGISGAEAPCGIWIASETSDHIFYEAATSPLHRDHIILHEVSHMLLNHTSVIDVDQPGDGGLFPDIDPATVVGFLARASYGSDDERDAERLAGLIANKAAPATRNSTTAHDRVLRRLDDALSDL
ncbi:hypothetical protein ACLIYP_01930 [Streptomyces nanhaiensis]|uniref:hypothetical protein n=1 Tax=Streptomyces nanhaiensis TaxID=679319 RepID=UPI00399D176D